MANLHTLPAELLDLIFANLDRRHRTYHHTSSLTRTCRALYSHFLPHLYRELRLGAHYYDGLAGLRIAKLVRTFLRNSSISTARYNCNLNDLAPFVKSISLGPINTDQEFHSGSVCGFTESEWDWFNFGILDLCPWERRPANFPFHFPRYHWVLQDATRDYFVAAILKRCTCLQEMQLHENIFARHSGVVEGFLDRVGIATLKSVEFQYEPVSARDLNSFENCAVETLKVKNLSSSPAPSYATFGSSNPGEGPLISKLDKLTSAFIETIPQRPEGLLEIVSGARHIKHLKWHEMYVDVGEQQRYPAGQYGNNVGKMLELYITALAMTSETVEHLSVLAHFPSFKTPLQLLGGGQTYGLQDFSKLMTLEVTLKGFILLTNTMGAPLVEILPRTLQTLKIRAYSYDPKFIKPQLDRIYEYVLSKDETKLTKGHQLRELHLDLPSEYEADISEQIKPVCIQKNVKLVVVEPEREIQDTINGEILMLPQNLTRTQMHARRHANIRRPFS